MRKLGAVDNSTIPAINLQFFAQCLLSLSKYCQQPLSAFTHPMQLAAGHYVIKIPHCLQRVFLLFMLLIMLLAAGCAKPRPNHVENICSIFRQYPDWYSDTKKAEKKWHIPISVQMAIIYQESGFNSSAKPPRKKLLWIIPWKRPSSAYGYSQALKNTWKDYEERTNQSCSRSTFDDATDFIGWYSNQICHTLHINPDNAYAIYLAYHEGPGGYARRSYMKKPWLIRVARKVSYRAKVYARQLAVCEHEFN